jgi:hypothetical protein
MPLDEFPERGLVPPAGESLKQSCIADGLDDQVPHPLGDSYL